MSDGTQISEGFVWDSPVPVEWLLAGTAAVLIWMAVLAASEWRLAKRPRLLPLLWLLRASAVGALAAAVAGPSLTLTRRETTRQAVTILVDTSGSMAIADDDGFVPEWTRPAPDDALTGRLAAARHHLQRLQSLPPGQWGTPAGLQRWADAVSVMKQTAGAAAPADFRAAATLLEETASAFTSGKNVLAKECLSVLSGAEAAVAGWQQTLDAAAGKRSAGPATGQKASRLFRVADWLESGESGWLRDCREEFDLTVLDAGAVISPAGAETGKAWRAARPDTSPQQTDLAMVLDEAARQAALGRTRAIVLVTDGNHNTPRDADEAASRLLGLPLLTVPAGAITADAARLDLLLTSVVAPASVYKNDALSIEPVIVSTGCEGRQVEAVLKEGDTVLDTMSCLITDGVPETPLKFDWRPDRVGRHELTVELSALKGEASLDNNTRTLAVEVLDSALRLLVADSEPRWETRYLLNLLRRDPRMEFEPMLFAPQHVAEGAPPEPLAFSYQLDDWARYRIVILGDVTPEQLTPEHQQILVKYVVERGGTLVLIAGDQAMPASYMSQPLGALVPVTRADIRDGAAFSVKLSEEGKEMDPGSVADSTAESDRVWHEATTSLPVYDLSPYSRPKPQSHVLLEAVDTERPAPPRSRAFLTWQDAGKGRVIYLAAPATWHLRYLSGDRWHYRFWGQLLQWAVGRTMSGGSRSVHLSADRPRLPQDAPLTLQLRLEDSLGKPVTKGVCQAVLRSADGAEKRVTFAEDAGVPGSYRAVLTGLPAGPQQITAEGETVDQLLKAEGRQGSVDTLVVVDPPENRESRGVLCDRAAIARLTAAAGGSVVPPGAVPEALNHLGLRPSVAEQTSLTPVWNEWPWLGLVLGLLTLEWILRKPAGLL